MKKLLTLVLTFVMLCITAIPALAATEPVITQQPQNPVYVQYGTAKYSVTVQGENLRCDWFLIFNDEVYNISNTSDGTKPWEPYAGETYGASKYVEGKNTTFTYSFNGIGKELNDSLIYAVIEDGHFEIMSSKSRVLVVEDGSIPPKTNVPVSLVVFKDDIVDLYCQANAVDGSKLSYLWYETSTGKLADITAINRGSEDKDTLRVDTGTYGTRYYVCAVDTADGGTAYSSIVPVTVIEKQATGEPPKITSKSLKEATVGEKYYAKIECSDADSVFTIYQNPGKANDFDKTGLVLTQHGEIEGTPSKAGTYTFTVCATGENGEGYMTYTLTVKEPVNETNKPTDGQDKPSVDADTPDTAPEKEDIQNNEDSSFDPIWVIAGVSLVAGIGACAVFLKKKK